MRNHEQKHQETRYRAENGKWYSYAGLGHIEDEIRAKRRAERAPAWHRAYGFRYEDTPLKFAYCPEIYSRPNDFQGYITAFRRMREQMEMRGWEDEQCREATLGAGYMVEAVKKCTRRVTKQIVIIRLEA
jgi:hypothetical protein